jgi:hypothetical protein
MVVRWALIVIKFVAAASLLWVDVVGAHKGIILSINLLLHFFQ